MSWRNYRERDALGEETDEMLRERLTRYARKPGVRVEAFEPRQGPVEIKGRALKIYNLEKDLAELLARHGLELDCDYDGSYVVIEGLQHYLGDW